MARGRMLLNFISDSKKMPKLKSDGARLLYTWALSHADITGCFYADAHIVNCKVFPRLKKSDRTVSGYLQELEHERLIVLFEDDSEKFFWIPDFIDKQPALYPDKEAGPYCKIPPALLKNSSIKTQELVKSCSRVTLPKEKGKEEKEKEVEEKDSQQLQILLEKYKNEIDIGMTPTNLEDLKGFMEAYPFDWIIKAIDVSAKRNKKSCAYIEGTLKGWKKDGAPSTESVKGNLAILARECSAKIGKDPCVVEIDKTYTDERCGECARAKKLNARGNTDLS